jgi:formylglycine-generating enzyme required for sulfatase activity
MCNLSNFEGAAMAKIKLITFGRAVKKLFWDSMKFSAFLFFCLLFKPCYGLSVHYFSPDNASSTSSAISPEVFRANRNDARNLLILVANWEYDTAPLRGPENDVELVRNFFRENQQYTGKYDIPDPLLNLNVVELHNRLEKLISDYANVNIEHLIFFYFGHGRAYDGKSYLIDRQLEKFFNLSEFPIASQRRVSEKLKAFNARRTLQVFDMCYSGGRSVATNLTRPDSEYLKWLRQSEGLWELNAARAVADEKPFGPEGRIYGALTWHLIDGLRNGRADGFRPAAIGQQPKRGVVTVSDLFYWIQDKIRTQVPSSPLRGSGEFMLLQYENPEREKELNELRRIISRGRTAFDVSQILQAGRILSDLQRKWVLDKALIDELSSEIEKAHIIIAGQRSSGERVPLRQHLPEPEIDEGPPAWLVGSSTVKPPLQTVPQPVQQVVPVNQVQQTLFPVVTSVDPKDPAASGFTEVLALIRQARNLEASDVIEASAKAGAANEKLSALMSKHHADSPLIQDLISSKAVLHDQTDAQFRAWHDDLRQRAARLEEQQRQERAREQARREREAERQRQESLAVKKYNEAYIAQRNGDYRKALELIKDIEKDCPQNEHATRLKDGSFHLDGRTLAEIKVLAFGHGQQHTFDGIEFVFIRSGEFMMGSNDYDSEKPVQKVKISNGFWMGKYEVTQGQWKSIMGNNPSHFKSGDNYPVEMVSWDNVQEFIKKLNKQSATCKRELDSEQVWRENADGCYRLPTEAEWEYAVRAGTSTKYSWGDNFDKTMANNHEGKTSAVGKYPANKWDLHDMHGNVWEWVLDWYDNSYYGKCDSSVCTDPVNLTKGLSRVGRGGCWSNSALVLRSALRGSFVPGRWGNYLGFRLVCPARL